MKSPAAASHWAIEADQHWAIFSSQSDVSDLLVTLFTDSESQQVNISGIPNKIAWVSLAQQQELLERELDNDDTDFLDRIDTGMSVEALLNECSTDSEHLASIVDKTNLALLLGRGFRELSTGETRRLMLARALLSKPELLILADPYTGLDSAHRDHLSKLLNELSRSIQIILATSRESEIGDYITHVALFDQQGNHDNVLTKTMTIEQWHQDPLIAQLKAQSAQYSESMLAFIKGNQHQSSFQNPIIEIKNGRVEYTDDVIFRDVNWQINSGQHWQVRGPNGCGKSTLLGMIFGDHPQCYSNDITIFGMQRGSGESVWDIKRHIGMVSSALHLQYRVNCSALEVVLSGFYDSIGVYKHPSVLERKQAQAWLRFFHMDHLSRNAFKSLEYGQQRLLLIARALVKKPSLLILDEPYQGLDFLNRRLVFNGLELIAAENLSQLLYVSHYHEDTLPSINHFIDFVADPAGGYYTVVTSQ
ncbi:ABC transporter [Vibrio sp. 10N.286.49.B3]|uniref:ATP-binding cassette domain-containing protein n=1 Tax=Vibrio sp. 10N.286.49.B3 TaxID=1880855 RepID=UPI000C858E5D|nr:ATP-binding cassette domain-containing protein [Vibrio sp. 10N.286.49.B3]PMH44464.1 ABC transporter [Vibrio sp. 10N.286.49.B3]